MKSDRQIIECHPGDKISFQVEASSANTELIGPFRAFMVASSNGSYLPVVQVDLSDIEKVSLPPVGISVTVQIDKSSDLGDFEISSLRLVPNDFCDPNRDIYREKEIQAVVDVDIAASPILRVSGNIEDWVGGTAHFGSAKFVL